MGCLLGTTRKVLRKARAMTLTAFEPSSPNPKPKQDGIILLRLYEFCMAGRSRGSALLCSCVHKYIFETQSARLTSKACLRHSALENLKSEARAKRAQQQQQQQIFAENAATTKHAADTCLSRFVGRRPIGNRRKHRCVHNQAGCNCCGTVVSRK